MHEAICGERILFPVEVCRPGGAVSVGRGFRTERAPLVPCVHVSPVSQLVVGHIVSGAAATDGAPAGRGEGPPPGTAGTPQPAAAHPHLQPTPGRTFPSSHRPSAGPQPTRHTLRASGVIAGFALPIHIHCQISTASHTRIVIQASENAVSACPRENTALLPGQAWY